VIRPRLLRLVMLVPLVAAGLYLVTGTSTARGAEHGDTGRGRELYLTGCSSCHGIHGKGVEANGEQRGPSLEHAGPAITNYMLTTGRMPLANSEDRPVRKDPAYDTEQIRDLIAYVSTLGEGPAIPDVDITTGDLAAGGELYRANCQPCHSASGAGGALSYGRAAPQLSKATPTQIGSAIRTGPGQMPVFGPDTLSSHEVDSIARYVKYLEHPDDRGGVSLGRLGPIPEGFLIWVLGVGLLIVICTWIGGRTRNRREVEPQP